MEVVIAIGNWKGRLNKDYLYNKHKKSPLTRLVVGKGTLGRVSEVGGSGMKRWKKR